MWFAKLALQEFAELVARSGSVIPVVIAAPVSKHRSRAFHELRSVCAYTIAVSSCSIECSRKPSGRLWK